MTFTPTEEAENILSTAKDLIDTGLHSSAELLLGYLLSTILTRSGDTTTLLIYSKASALLADALVESGEIHRAVKLYDTALRSLSNAANFAREDKAFHYNLREKQARCYRTIGQLKEATTEMEKIPLEYMSLKACRMLARWYEEQMRFNQAKDIYLHILRKQPLATEAMMGALRYGVEFDALLQCFPPTASGGWLKEFIWSYAARRNYRYGEALDRLQHLNNITHLNLDVMLAMADCYFKDGDVIRAHYQYRQIMKREQHVVKQMDRYACILKMRGHREALAKHAMDLSRKHPTHPESWLAMGQHAHLTGDLESAMRFVERALGCDRCHAEAWQFKGTILATSHKSQDSLPAFRTALSYDASISIYEGMITVYISQNRYIDAQTMARDVYATMHNSARALLLIGNVFLSQPSNLSSRKKGGQYLEEAYRMSPQCTEIVLAYESFLESVGEWEKAEGVLREHMGHVQMATLHVRLGEILVGLRRFEEAMAEFNTALGIDSNHEPALKGLRRLHRVLGSGVDEMFGSEGEEMGSDGDVEELSNGIPDD